MSTPEVAEDRHDLLECRLRIGFRHRLTDAVQPSALGHIVEHRFEQSSARSKLIVNGQPRHAGFLGYRVERNAIGGCQHCPCSLQQACTCPLRCHTAAETPIRTRESPPAMRANTAMNTRGSTIRPCSRSNSPPTQYAA